MFAFHLFFSQSPTSFEILLPYPLTNNTVSKEMALQLREVSSLQREKRFCFGSCLFLRVWDTLKERRSAGKSGRQVTVFFCALGTRLSGGFGRMSGNVHTTRSVS